MAHFRIGRTAQFAKADAPKHGTTPILNDKPILCIPQEPAKQRPNPTKMSFRDKQNYKFFL
jgi:hypothetical protein